MDWLCNNCYAVTVNSGPTDGTWVMSCECPNSAGVKVRSDLNLGTCSYALQTVMMTNKISGECFTALSNGTITC